MPDYESEPPVFFDSEEAWYDEAPPAAPRTKMSNIRRNWNRLPISDRIAFGRKVIVNQKKTPSPIPHPDPDLAALDGDCAAAEASDARVADLEQQLTSARAARVAKVDRLSAGLDHNASHVESDTKGDAAAILAVGYELVGVPQPVGPMPQVKNQSLSTGDADGQLDQAWDRIDGASGYESQYTTNPMLPAGWVSLSTVTQSSRILTGLPSGQRCWTRVRAIGPLGPGPWSDEASKMVP